MKQTKLQPRQSSWTSTPLLVAAAILLLVPLAALTFAFVYRPHLSPQQAIFANFFFALVSGSAGCVWGDVVLRISGTVRGGLKVAIDATGGSALFILCYFNPIFKPVPPPPAPQVIVRRVCGQTAGVGQILPVEPMCTIEGEIRGVLEADSQICISVTSRTDDLPEPPKAECQPAAPGGWTFGNVAIRVVGALGVTNAEVSATLANSAALPDSTPSSALVSSAVVPLMVPAPLVRIETVSKDAGFTVRGTADGLLDEEQVVVRVEESGSGRHAASWLYGEKRGRDWVAQDSLDEPIGPTDVYLVATLIGPRSATPRSAHKPPDGFRAVGDAREFKLVSRVQPAPRPLRTRFGSDSRILSWLREEKPDLGTK